MTDFQNNNAKRAYEETKTGHGLSSPWVIGSIKGMVSGLVTFAGLRLLGKIGVGRAATRAEDSALASVLGSVSAFHFTEVEKLREKATGDKHVPTRADDQHPLFGKPSLHTERVEKERRQNANKTDTDTPMR